MTKRNYEQRINLRIPSELAELIAEDADHEAASDSWIIRRILIAHYGNRYLTKKNENVSEND